MIKRILGAALSVAVILMAHAASAEDFTFSFMGSASNPGIVTGTIRGLNANGTSSASSVTAVHNGSSFDLFVGTDPAFNTFTTSQGVLTAARLDAGLFAPSLTLNSTVGGVNSLFSSSYDPITDTNSPGYVANSGSFSGVTYSAIASTNPFASSAVSAVSAAPEPGTWALMLGGVGMIGAMVRVAQARRREDELKSTATA